MKAFEHGGNIHIWKECQPDLLDYSANINPLGMPESVSLAVAEAISGQVHYPEPRARTLQRKLAAHYQIRAEEIFVANGAAEALYLLAGALKLQKALVMAPTFSEYERSLLPEECEIQQIELLKEENFAIPLEVVKSRLGQVDIAYFGNPNNPAGAMETTEEWRALLKVAQESSTFVVVDESFLDFFPEGGTSYSAKPLLEEGFDNLLVLHSLTKFFALPGLRLGFVASSPRIIEALESRSDVWNVNGLAQIAGLAALEDKEYQAKTRIELPKWQKDMMDRVGTIEGIQWSQPQVNFVLGEIQDRQLTATELVRSCAKRGLLIRDCSNFKGLGSYWFRLAIRGEKENTRAVQILKEVWSKSRNS